jgi:glycosyltransferase involved in cell wall biosynthesis
MHPEFKLLLYTPIDSNPDPSWFKHAKDFDQIITYTKYGFDEIQKIKRLKNLEIIPHGFDTKNFFEQSGQKEECRKRVGIPQGKFVIGTVNKNQPRKDMANALIAFAEFKDTLPKGHNVCLYLHTYYDDPTGVNLRTVGDKLGLVWEKDYTMPMHKKYTDGAYTLSDMNDVYNSFDVFLTTSTAEGWGLTLTEAICCKLPIIFGYHTSQKEIAAPLKSGKCIELTKSVQIHDGNAIRYKLNPTEIAEWMNLFYKQYQAGEKENFDKYDEVIKKYNWDSIAIEWSVIIAKLLK